MHKKFYNWRIFIGSHLTEYIFNKYKNSKIYVYDKITYAANIKNLETSLKAKIKNN